jgi:hypothetical protein
VTFVKKSVSLYEIANMPVNFLFTAVRDDALNFETLLRMRDWKLKPRIGLLFCVASIWSLMPRE